MHLLRLVCKIPEYFLSCHFQRLDLLPGSRKFERDYRQMPSDETGKSFGGGSK